MLRCFAASAGIRFTRERRRSGPASRAQGDEAALVGEDHGVDAVAQAHAAFETPPRREPCVPLVEHACQLPRGWIEGAVVQRDSLLEGAR